MGEQESKMASPCIVNATVKHTATVIFMHGLGDTGHGWSYAMKSIASSIKHVKFICPTAQTMPVTLNGGLSMPSWFDLRSLDMTVPEDEPGIIKARDELHQLIEQEVKNGINYNRIMIGGFSQGGALALYSLLTNKNTLAGTIALSSWLPLRKQFPQNILGNKNTPILQCHGDSDPVVPFNFGKLSYELLKPDLPNIIFKTYRNMGHSSCDEEMKEVQEFIAQQLPPI